MHGGRRDTNESLEEINQQNGEEERSIHPALLGEIGQPKWKKGGGGFQGKTGKGGEGHLTAARRNLTRRGGPQEKGGSRKATRVKTALRNKKEKDTGHRKDNTQKKGAPKPRTSTVGKGKEGEEMHCRERKKNGTVELS